MDYPHGRHPHPHHHYGGDRREDEELHYGYPTPEGPHPPPFYGGDGPPPHSPPFYGGDAPPPPPQVYQTSHIGPPRSDAYHPPPPHTGSNYYPGPPPPAQDHPDRHPHTPHFPPISDHHIHHKDGELDNRPSVRMYCKAEPNYSLTIRDGKVVLARADPSDPCQHWIKEEKFSTRVKDEEGFPSFALINKATGQAMKHATGATHPVQLTLYNPNCLDESILWTESKDLGDGHRAIRMVNNIRLNVDAFNGDKNHGGVRDGTTIVLWEWKKGDNQRWIITPYSCKSISAI